ncbi:MAG: hypothetical protein ACLRFE_01195 [Clostridia bacterium]
MKKNKNNLIKQDIHQQKTQSPHKHISECPPVLGKKIHEIKVDVEKYRKTNAIIMSVLSSILILIFVRFILIFNHWLVITISFTTILCCIVWTIFAVKKSLIKVEYTLYENYVLKAYEDACTYADNSKFMGYKIKTSIVDKMFKPKTKTIILYYSNKYLPYLKLSCISEDTTELIELIQKHCSKSTKKESN